MKLSVGFFSLFLSTAFASSETPNSSLKLLEPLSLPFKAESPTHFNESDGGFLQTDFLDILNEVPMREGSPIGIVDRGDSCYADCVIQMLFRIPAVRKIVANLDIYHSRAKLLDGIVSKIQLEDIFNDLKVLEGLNHMFYQLQTNEITKNASYDFGLSSKLLPVTRAQGDASEYFNFIISAIRTITPESQHHHFVINFTIFSGNSRPQRHEIADGIYLPVIHKESQSLDQLLDDYFAPEAIELEFNTILRVKRIESFPDFIQIRLQRFSFYYGNYESKTNVMIPDEIDVAKYSVCSSSTTTNTTNNNTKYRLKMFIYHTNEYSNGHFISHSRNNSNSWSTFDDNKVILKEDPDIIQNNLEAGFIYFYEKIKD